ncbi:hypothetical protein [Lactobacillus sp. LL6]|uniref:hypothetical protein n=1 Tax=Lactobacillus sp. LL6 TaxID=2596827 RepID=UPI0016424C86|nr:hypothetical protein [Lactobacillus sp. LL6]
MLYPSWGTGPQGTPAKTLTVAQLGNNAAYRLPDYFKYLLDNNESSYPSYY